MKILHTYVKADIDPNDDKVEKLAWDILDFYEYIDTYDYMDNVEDSEEEVNRVISSLLSSSEKQGIIDGINEYMDDIEYDIEDGTANDYEMDAYNRGNAIIKRIQAL